MNSYKIFAINPWGKVGEQINALSFEYVSWNFNMNSFIAFIIKVSTLFIIYKFCS